ncbi:MAG: DUF1934 domain-containing protein [Acetatifactor sp.]
MHVTLTITGTQTGEDNESMTITTRAEGEYFERGNSTYLLYDETDPDDGSITKNMLKLSGGVLSLSKKGAVNSNMTWEEGKTIVSDYSSAFGRLMLSVKTERLKICDSDRELRLEIDYLLSMEDTFLSDNSLSILVHK